MFIIKKKRKTIVNAINIIFAGIVWQKVIDMALTGLIRLT